MPKLQTCCLINIPYSDGDGSEPGKRHICNISSTEPAESRSIAGQRRSQGGGRLCGCIFCWLEQSAIRFGDTSITGSKGNPLTYRLFSAILKTGGNEKFQNLGRPHLSHSSPTDV